MFKLGLVFVALVASAGCKKKGAEPPDCARALFHSMELAKETMTKNGADAALMRKLTNIGIDRCKEDKWPADAIACMTNAQTESASQGCYGKLSKEQQDKMNAAAIEAMSAAMGSGSAAPAAGSGSADSGSAAPATGSGSADSGSAAPATGSAGAGSAH